MSDDLFEVMATRVFTTAIKEARCGEVLNRLFEGGSVTVDIETGELVFITREQMQAMSEPQFGCCEEHFPSPAMTPAEQAEHVCPVCGWTPAEDDLVDAVRCVCGAPIVEIAKDQFCHVGEDPATDHVARLDAPEDEEDTKPVALTQYQAGLAHYALADHRRRQGGDRRMDDAHNEMIEAIDAAMAALEEAHGPFVAIA